MNGLKKASLHILSIMILFSLLLGFVPANAAGQPPAPKNIIVMISDGMGFNTPLLASYYMTGSANRQQYYRFPVQLAMSTYPGSEWLGAPAGDPCFGWGYDPVRAWSEFTYVNICYTDSASAGTAMATGVKTYNAAIGLDINGNRIKNVVEAAEEKGMATGVVTSVEFSHATPASFVAHNLSRNNYEAIAREMILESSVDVIMGTGHPWFDDSGKPKTVPNYRYVGGQSTWEALLAGTAGNDADGDGQFDAWKLVQSRLEFRRLLGSPTPKRVIGVPQVYSTLQQSRSGDGYADPYAVPLNKNVPTLAEMTLAALNVLDEDPDGLFLMVEGGAVDWAQHANQTGRTIEEQNDFDMAVIKVIQWIEKNSSWDETLLIITADHETGLLWGPGSNPAWMPIVNNGQGVVPGVQFNSGNHSNSLVPFFAKGYGADWFTSYASFTDPVRGPYIDNTDIGKVIFSLLGGE
jgi:alkaline phosphatase